MRHCMNRGEAAKSIIIIAQVWAERERDEQTDDTRKTVIVTIASTILPQDAATTTDRDRNRSEGQILEKTLRSSRAGGAAGDLVVLSRSECVRVSASEV